MLTDPGDLDAAVAAHVVVDLGAALGVDAMSCRSAHVRCAEASADLGAVSRAPARAGPGHLLERGLEVTVVPAKEGEEGERAPGVNALRPPTVPRRVVDGLVRRVARPP